jgi:hypothetical protein
MACLLLANYRPTLAQFAGVAAVGELRISRYITVPLAGFSSGSLSARNYKSVEKICSSCVFPPSVSHHCLCDQPDWGIILKDALTPTIKLEADYMLAVLAVIAPPLPWVSFTCRHRRG